jgi:hypothetical protein
MKRTIIGFGHVAQSGKDTAARYLAVNHFFTHGAFAGALKDAAGAMFGLSTEQLHGRTKEVVDPFWGVTPRNLLQRLGTEAGRNVFGDDIWIRALRRRIETSSSARWAISDVRFPNEAEAIRAWGGYLVRIDRPGAGATGGIARHASETALEGWDGWDETIVNDSTLDAFHTKIEDLHARIATP